MIKCVECGKELVNGGTRYVATDGSYCPRCWEKKDQRHKDAVLIRATYGLGGFVKAIADVKKGGYR